MADVTIGSDLKINETGVGAQAITAEVNVSAGEWLYRTATGGAALARSNAAGTSNVIGVAINNAITGGTVYYNSEHPIVAGAVFTKDVTYYLSSATAGKAAPFADLASGSSIVILGVGKSTTEFIPSIKNTGVLKT